MKIKYNPKVYDIYFIGKKLMTNITFLSKEANESGTYIVEIKFRDEDGNLIVPNSVKWSLYDVNGNFINNRKDIEILEPSSISNIILQGDDLPTGWNYITIRGTYNSDYGDNLPFTDSVKFYVRDLIDE